MKSKFQLLFDEVSKGQGIIFKQEDPSKYFTNYFCYSVVSFLIPEKVYSRFGISFEDFKKFEGDGALKLLDSGIGKLLILLKNSEEFVYPPDENTDFYIVFDNKDAVIRISHLHSDCLENENKEKSDEKLDFQIINNYGTMELNQWD